MNLYELINALFPFKRVISFGFGGKMLAITDEARAKVDEKLEMIDVPDQVKVHSHKCVLHKHPKNHNSGWNCDKITGVKRCLSGMTDFYMAKLAKPPIHGWRCL